MTEILPPELVQPDTYHPIFHHGIIMQEILGWLYDGSVSNDLRLEIFHEIKTGVTLSKYSYAPRRSFNIESFQGKDSIQTLLNLALYAGGGHRIYARTPVYVKEQVEVLRVASDGQDVTLLEVCQPPYLFTTKRDIVISEEIAKTVFNTDTSNKEILVDYLAEEIPSLSNDILGAVG